MKLRVSHWVSAAMLLAVSLGAMAQGRQERQGEVAPPASAGRIEAAALQQPSELPRPAWQQGDPADSLYRAARAALNRNEYRQAAELFRRIPRSFPRSVYAGD